MQLPLELGTVLDLDLDLRPNQAHVASLHIDRGSRDEGYKQQVFLVELPIARSFRPHPGYRKMHNLTALGRQFSAPAPA